MSHSPERISSYRRHFEDSSSSSYQVRVSSPSPTRRDARAASASYPCRGAGSMRMESGGRRTVSAARKTRMLGSSVSAGAMVCVGPSGEPAMDLDAAAVENSEFRSTRTSERQEMVVLNDRLAIYIDKVRSLEQQNKLLEAEIEAYQNRFVNPSGLRLLYEEQLRELKKIAEQMRVQRDISLAAKESTAAQLEAIKIKYEEAVELRKKAELDIEVFRPDVDKATSSRIALEKKLEQLEVEIEFLKRVHQQEIEELMKQIYAAHVSAESAFALPDLAGALKQIQQQYDDIAAKNLQEMDGWYKNKFEDITSKTSKHVDRIRGAREELAGAKKDIQSKERDLDSLRTRNEALEAQIREMHEKYRKELEDLQARIEALQLELKSIKEKIALHLREYQELLNVKMSLEIEITTYRKLIEGEDLRLAGMVKSLSLTSCNMSAISAGVSFSGEIMGGAGGMGGGMIGARAGGVGGTGVGVGMGAGGMGTSSGTGGVGGRAGMAGGADVSGLGGGGTGARAGAGGLGTGMGSGVGAAGMSGAAGFGAGGVGAGTGVGGMGAGVGAMGAAGMGTGAGGVGAAGMGIGAGGVGAGGVGTGAGGMGAGGMGTGARGMGAGAGTMGTGAGGMGAGGMGTGTGGLGAGAGAGGMGTGAGGMGAGGMGTGAGGMGAGGMGAGAEGMGAGGMGTGAGGIGAGAGDMGIAAGLMGAGAGTGHKGMGAGVGGAGVGAGIGTAGPGGMGGTDLGISDGISDSIDKDGGREPGMGGRVGGGAVVGGSDAGVALSGTGGVGRGAGGMGDTSGTWIGYSSDGYDGSDSYAEQAVELTERRTVLIRTVKSEDDVVETDHHEQTYTITGAASDSDDE